MSGSLFYTGSKSQLNLGSTMVCFPSTYTCKDRVSCEVNSIGATGAGILLLTRTTICVGVRKAQKVQDSWMDGSDSCWFTE